MWQTHITVAAIIEKNNQFLLVTDKTSSGNKLNQPAGHLEAGEDIIAAIIREVKEETSLEFTPEKIVGIYLFHPNPDNTYLRVCFKGKVSNQDATPAPSADDDGVLEAGWYDLDEIQLRKSDLRSNLVLACINDYLSGKELSLETVTDFRENKIIDIE